MASTSAWRRALLAALAAGAVGCREEITATGACPTLCPSAAVQLADTTLTGVVASDSSFRGYVTPAEASILPASDLEVLRSLAVIRFARRGERWFPRGDTAGVTIGSIDSVSLDLRLQSRDTAVKDLRILVYRLPAGIDSTATYASVTRFFTDSLLIDSMPVPDTLATGTLRRLLPKDAVEPAAADSGVVAIGLGLRAAGRTTVSLAAVEAGGTAVPALRFYVRGPAPQQDTLRHTFSQTPSFDSFVAVPEPGEPGSALAVGNIPAARSLLRFNIPAFLTDSVSVVRGTLILTPARPATGLPRETFEIEARAIVRDFGGKSILHPDTAIAGRASVAAGQSRPVELEVGFILAFWAAFRGDSIPRAVVLRLVPEGRALGEVAFHRAGTGAGAPRLRVTYVRPYRFVVP